MGGSGGSKAAKDGALIEWVCLLLYLCQDLLEPTASEPLLAVATKLIDALCFQDQLMCHPGALLAAAVLHGAVQLCSKAFRDYTFLRKVCHLCQAPDGDVAGLSERILQATVGQRCAEVVLEGSPDVLALEDEL